MGRYKKSEDMSLELPEEMSETVKKIINTKTTNLPSNAFVGYKEEDLNEARVYLQKNKKSRD